MLTLYFPHTLFQTNFPPTSGKREVPLLGMGEKDVQNLSVLSISFREVCLIRKFMYTFHLYKSDTITSTGALWHLYKVFEEEKLRIWCPGNMFLKVRVSLVKLNENFDDNKVQHSSFLRKDYDFCIASVFLNKWSQ